jgi:hypothetical protein
MIPTIPDGLRDAVIALLGAAALKGYDYLLGSKKRDRDEDRDLRKELRDEIMYLHSRIESLESDLHATKTKYWEDVELIYQLKTNNIALRSKLRDAETSEHNIAETTPTEDLESPEDLTHE